MIAGILRCLGVFMGEKFGEEAGGSNHEDLEFQLKPVNVLKEMIDRRNLKHDVWGWKDPSSVFKINSVLCKLRNPHFISVFRDPYAIAESEFKYNDRPLKDGLKIGIGHLAQLSMFCVDCNRPNFMISYEKALADKEKLVHDIIMYLNLTVSKEQKQKAINFITPGKYAKL